MRAIEFLQHRSEGCAVVALISRARRARHGAGAGVCPVPAAVWTPGQSSKQDRRVPALGELAEQTSDKLTLEMALSARRKGSYFDGRQAVRLPPLEAEGGPSEEVVFELRPEQGRRLPGQNARCLPRLCLLPGAPFSLLFCAKLPLPVPGLAGQTPPPGVGGGLGGGLPRPEQEPVLQPLSCLLSSLFPEQTLNTAAPLESASPPALQRWRSREVKRSAQGHTASKC